MKICVFDVETSGLLPFRGRTFASLLSGGGGGASAPANPHILQLSYVIYDTATRDIASLYDKYIQISEEVDIPEETTKINHITREMCANQDISVPIETALSAFYHAILESDVIVAHNLQFDQSMVCIELNRHRSAMKKKCPHFEDIITSSSSSPFASHVSTSFRHYELRSRKQKIWKCTMKMGTDMCNLQVLSRDKVSYYTKFPTLKELFLHIYQNCDLPEHMHNSIVDSLMCLQCFLFIDDIIADKPEIAQIMSSHFLLYA